VQHESKIILLWFPGKENGKFDTYRVSKLLWEKEDVQPKP